MNLWKYIYPDRANRPHWPEEPERPTYQMFGLPETPAQKRERLFKVNAELTARNSGGRAPRVPDGIVVGDHGPDDDDGSATVRNDLYTLETLPPVPCTKISQLDKNDLAAYTDLYNIYKDEKRDWETHSRNKKELADWVLDSVEKSFAENKLRHELDLDDWFALLKTHAEPYVKHQQTATERAYDELLQIYRKKGKKETPPMA
ncbi:hypothetical protein V8F06_013329 [Rhypophila decipiens]